MGASSSTQPGRYPCFDGLRAFAALCVIGVHTSFVSGFGSRHGVAAYTARLEIGVEVFFVISGFLLYRRFAAAHFGLRGPVDLCEFWWRRLKRIVPAYWLAFLVTAYLMHAVVVRHSWYAPLVYLGFAQIYLPHYVLTGLTQAWSLCTEMSFYAFLPLYGLVVGSRPRSLRNQLRAELVGLAALVGVSFAWRVPVLEAHGPLAATMPNWLPAYLDVFALGMGLAVASAWLEARGQHPSWLWHKGFPATCWLVALVAFWAVSNLGLPEAPIVASALGPSLARQSLYGLFGLAVVAPAVFGPQDEGLIRAVLRSWPAGALGVVSYGVYLWHEVWISQYLRWTHSQLFHLALPGFLLAVVALSVTSATLSYVLVERPVLHAKRLVPRLAP